MFDAKRSSVTSENLFVRSEEAIAGYGFRVARWNAREGVGIASHSVKEGWNAAVSDKGVR